METLLFDRDCGFCRTVLGAILMRDRAKRIRPIPLQEALASDLLPGMSEEDRFASFHLVADDGTVLSGGKALPALFEGLPGLHPLGVALAAVQPLTDAVYKVISANRSRIGPYVPEGWKARADATIARRRDELGTEARPEAAEELEQATGPE
jgi:predicted DCC family thiol-disulfide oxidoreductase YuxK